MPGTDSEARDLRDYKQSTKTIRESRKFTTLRG